MTLSALPTFAIATLPAAVAGTIFREVPVQPDSDEARNLLIDELAKAPYQAAQPTLFDRVSKWIFDLFASFEIGDGNGIPTVVTVVLIALVIIAIVAALLVYGIPRLNRKSKHTALLFGDVDYRSASQLRSDAEQAASRQDWAAAVTDMFRSIARGLSERTIVTTTPGTTAYGFAKRAGEVLREHADELTVSANTFDRVRYMQKASTREEYEQLRDLETQVRTSKIDLAEAGV